ncbi:MULTISPECIES: hypothetical protein [unclassified Chamaesiphon]|nr:MULTISPECIES: hypothetical protein [unclassified Chamaesiphon]
MPVYYLAFGGGCAADVRSSGNGNAKIEGGAGYFGDVSFSVGTSSS